MLNCAHNYLSLSPHRSPLLRILWSKPSPTHRARGSWRPSKISLIFCTFAKTELGGLQENPNVLPLLTWRPSNPRNIHAGFLTPAATKNAHFLLPNPTNLGGLHQNPHVLQLLTRHPSKPPNIHAPFLNPKSPKTLSPLNCTPVISCYFNKNYPTSSHRIKATTGI